MEDQHLLPQQLAERLRLNVRTLDNWRSLGTGPAYIKVGGLVRYRLEDVLAWETSRLHNTG